METQPHWTMQIPSQGKCPDCGHPGSGNYCQQCGQRLLKHRLQVREILQEMFSRIFNHERGLFYTMYSMLIRPGTVIRDYVSGKQKHYVAPLTIFFVGATAQLLNIWFSSSIIREMIQDEFQKGLAAQAEKQRETLQSLFGGEAAERLADAYISALQQGYTYLALFAFGVPWAVLLALGHRWVGPRYRLAETTVYSLYVLGMILLLTAVLGFFTLRWAPAAHFPLAMVIYFLFPLWAHTGFFTSGWLSRLVTVAATFVSAICFMLAMILTFAIVIFL